MKKTMLSKTEVEALVAKSNDSYEEHIAAVKALFEGNAHIVCGYPSWVAFAIDRLTHYKVSPEQRLAAVVDMKAVGMANPSIGAALGVSEKTVERDLKAATPTNVGVKQQTTKPKPAAGTKVGKKKTTPAQAKVAGAKWKAEVENYRALRLAHPLWKPGAFREHLGLKHSIDVTRLRVYADGPPDLTNLVYEGKISRNSGEMILRTNPKLTDEAKVALGRKAVDGLIPASLPSITEVINTTVKVAQTNNVLSMKWLSQDAQMSFNDLKVAILDAQAETEHALEKQAIEDKKIDIAVDAAYGVGIDKWLTRVETEIMTLAEQVNTTKTQPLMAKILAKRMRKVSADTWDLADVLDGSAAQQAPAPAPATEEPVQASDVIVGSVI